MSVVLKQFDGVNVSPVDDATYREWLFEQSGFFTGAGVPTFVDGAVISVGAGYGVVQGRQFVIQQEDVSVSLSASDTLGRLKLVIDLSNSDTPISFVSETASSALPALVQQDLNDGGTVYKLAIATYTVGSSSISSMVDARNVVVFPQIEYGATDLVAGTSPLETGTFYFYYT